MTKGLAVRPAIVFTTARSVAHEIRDLRAQPLPVGEASFFDLKLESAPNSPLTIATADVTKSIEGTMYSSAGCPAEVT